MKKQSKIFVIIILLTLGFVSHSCKKQKDELEYYKENKLSFFALQENLLADDWIRDPKNLAMVHETFKEYGYSNILTDQLLNQSPIVYRGLYLKRDGKNLIDSLELTYKDYLSAPTYYREFWQRRCAEKNDSVVYVILSDIKNTIQNKEHSQSMKEVVDLKLVNDTLLELLELEIDVENMNDENAMHHFDILKKYGLHQSAYNLLYERYAYSSLKWNVDSLRHTLVPTKEFQEAWVMDDMK